MAKVAVISCSSYNQDKVNEAVARSLVMLGGLERFVKPGDRVLLKVNCLMGEAPETAITTHPAVVAAVVKEVIRVGGIALVGDSPGNASANALKILRDAGIKEAAEAAGAQALNFAESGARKIKNPDRRYLGEFKIAEAVFAADVIINLPKLKTHNFMLMTGAVKNLLGVVPGFAKSEFHVKAPQPEQFAELLVALMGIVRPRLSIMDAVVGMEGLGPSEGKPRDLGLIMASEDAVAMDTVAAYLIGFHPEEVPTVRLANRQGLGAGDLKKIEIIGPPIEKFRQADWEHGDSAYQILSRLPGFLIGLLKPWANRIRVEPVIDIEKCTACLICEKNCPAQVIQINQNGGRKIDPIDYRSCIMCFCCHELCQYQAITLKRNWWAKRLGIGEKNGRI